MSTGALNSFRLRVASDRGPPVVLELECADAAAAVRRASQLGHVVLAIEPASHSIASRSPRGRKFSLLLFNQELLALLEAGLNLNEALATLVGKEPHGGIRQLLQTLVGELGNGRNFSDVLAEHPERFPAVYVAIIRAAERTGDLPPALARFIAYQLQFDQVRRKLVAASIYPAMLLVVGGAVTLFLVVHVVPRFAAVYDSAGRNMPAASAALLAIGQFMQAHGAVLLATAALALLLIAGLVRRAGWSGIVDALAWLPGLAERVLQFQLARFYRALGLLLAAGVSLPRAMGMVEGLLAPTRRQSLHRVRERVEQGRPLTASLTEQGLATPVAQSLLAVGERSGQLAGMLERAARFLDDDLERWLDWGSRLLEPLLMVLIGIVVGGVVLLLYMPIFELAGGL